MCLETIDWCVKKEDEWKKDEEWKDGYKCVVMRGDKEEEKSYYAPCMCGEYVQGMQTDTNKEWIFAGHNQYYPAGYHVWINKEDALKDKRHFEIVIKVQVRGMVAIGQNCILPHYNDNFGQCMVAKEMFIEGFTPIEE